MNPDSNSKISFQVVLHKENGRGSRMSYGSLLIEKRFH